MIVEINVSEQQLSQVIDRLDQVKLELLRLRAILLPEEELSPEEKTAIEESRREVVEGKCKTFDQLLKEVG